MVKRERERAEVVRRLPWGIWSRRERVLERSELGPGLLLVGEEGEWVNRGNALAGEHVGCIEGRVLS